jgi:hypothetical protein
MKDSPITLFLALTDAVLGVNLNDVIDTVLEADDER